jgi:SNF2 family DNA or RNA helicase
VTELWSIVNMATGNQVLGKLKDFNREYGKPIRDARCRNASSYAMKKGQEANDALQGTLKSCLLRRRKLELLRDELPTKRDVCVWVKPSKQQARMYKETVESSFHLVRDILSADAKLANKAKMGAFQVLAELKDICGHPLRRLKGGPGGSIRSALEQTDLPRIVQGSRKLELAIHLLRGFKADDHKTLLFSQSTQNLDIIEYVLLKKGGSTVKLARLDGSVPEKRRRDIVDLFQKGAFDVLLLTTGAGGVGLTLTRASRVIVYDPSWNPSQDAQAGKFGPNLIVTQPKF